METKKKLTELTKDHIERCDEIENSVFDLCKIMINDANLKWDMSIIGDVADMVAEYLAKRGYKIYYPALVEDDNGKEVVVEYFNDYIE